MLFRTRVSNLTFVRFYTVSLFMSIGLNSNHAYKRGYRKTKKQEKKIFLQKNTEKISDHHLEVNPVLVKFVYKTKNLKKQVHFYYD